MLDNSQMWLVGLSEGITLPINIPFDPKIAQFLNSSNRFDGKGRIQALGRF
jgi:hypothetical protein